MTSQDQQSEGDDVELAAVEKDIKSQMRRIKSVLDGGRVSPEAALDEVLHTVFPLMLDHLKLTDRLEEHAEWAGEQIDYLASDQTPPTSQLLAEDADRIRLFIDKVVALCNATLAALPSGDETAKQRADLVQIAEAGTELRSFVDDIRLEEDDGDDSPSADDVARDALDQAVRTLPREDGIRNLPPVDGNSQGSA